VFRDRNVQASVDPDVGDEYDRNQPGSHGAAMKPRDTFRLAARSLSGHRLRSVLTTVGIVIGIGTVIVFASFGTSVQTDVVSEVEDTAANEVFIVAGELDDGDDGLLLPGSVEDIALPAITEHDIEQLEQVSGARAVVPQGEIDATSATVGNDTVVQTSLTATTTAAFDSDGFREGEAFTAGASGEIVLDTAAADGFETNVSAGDSIDVEFAGGTETFTVVGIAESVRGGFGGGIGGFGGAMFVPVEPYYDEYGDNVTSPTQGEQQRAFRQVTVLAEGDRIEATRDAAEAYITDTGAADAPQITDGEITVQSTSDFIDSVNNIIGDIVQLVSGVGVLALLVGVVGIVNIMLVSVSERTREIGIMKATGARNRDIMGLFLTEAVLLGLLGALVGIPLGLAIGYGAAVYADVGFTVPYDWILLATVVGILSGAVSGLYPAWRAASVDPIDALRRN
jgi:putative ABC transport system permease protein